MTLELPAHTTTMTNTMHRTTTNTISKKKRISAIKNSNKNSNSNNHKRKSLSLYEKGQIVIEAYSSINNIKPTARKYNVQPHQIREWKLLNVQNLLLLHKNNTTSSTGNNSNNSNNENATSMIVPVVEDASSTKGIIGQQSHNEQPKLISTSSSSSSSSSSPANVQKYEIQKQHQQQSALLQKTTPTINTTTPTINTTSDYNMENINTTNTTMNHNMIGIKELQLVCLQHCKSISKSFHRNQLDPSDLETIHTLQRYIMNHHHHCSSSSNKITMKLLIHHLQSIDPIKYGNISYPILKQKIIRILKQWNGRTGIQSSSIQHQHQSIKKIIRVS